MMRATLLAVALSLASVCSARAQTISLGGFVTKPTHLELRGIGLGSSPNLFNPFLGADNYPAPLFWGGVVQIDLPGRPLWTGLSVQIGQSELYRFAVRPSNGPAFDNTARLRVTLLEVPIYGTFAKALGAEFSAGARLGLARVQFTQTGWSDYQSPSQPMLTEEIERTTSRFTQAVGARASVGLPLHLRADLDAGYRWLSVGLPLATAPGEADYPLIVYETYLDMTGFQAGLGLRYAF